MATGIESEPGPKAIQIHLHKDEGHLDEGGKWKPDLHGHIGQKKRKKPQVK